MSHSPYLDSFSILRNLSFQIKLLYIIRCKPYPALFLFLSSKCFANLSLQFVEKFRVILEQCLAGIGTLSEFRTAIAIPAAALFDDIVGYSQAEYLAGTADTFAKHDVELSLAERRSHLVLYYLYANQITYYLIAILDGCSFADIQTH